MFLRSPGCVPESLMAGCCSPRWQKYERCTRATISSQKKLTIHFNKACRPDMRRAESCVIVGVPVAICIVCIESFWFQLLSRVESVRFITSGGGHVCRCPGATQPLLMAGTRLYWLVGKQNWWICLWCPGFPKAVESWSYQLMGKFYRVQMCRVKRGQMGHFSLFCIFLCVLLWVTCHGY